jgi:hypothetical protein
VVHSKLPLLSKFYSNLFFYFTKKILGGRTPIFFVARFVEKIGGGLDCDTAMVSKISKKQVGGMTLKLTVI